MNYIKKLNNGVLIMNKDEFYVRIKSIHILPFIAFSIAFFKDFYNSIFYFLEIKYNYPNIIFFFLGIIIYICYILLITKTYHFTNDKIIVFNDLKFFRLNVKELSYNDIIKAEVQKLVGTSLIINFKGDFKSLCIIDPRSYFRKAVYTIVRKTNNTSIDSSVRHFLSKYNEKEINCKNTVTLYDFWMVLQITLLAFIIF